MTEFLAQSRVKLSPPCHDGIDCLPFSPLSGVSGVTDEGDSLAISFLGQGYYTSVSCPVILMMEVSNRTLPPVEQANRQGNRMPPLPTVAPHGMRIPEEVSSPSQAQLAQAVGRMLFSEREQSVSKSPPQSHLESRECLGNQMDVLPLCSS